MPKYPPEKDMLKDLKNYIQLTWEVVRRNPDYRNDYNKFLQNYGLSPQDVKEKVNPDGSHIIPAHPGHQRTYYLDPRKERFVPKEGTDPDRESCNLPFMLKRWGFACDPDESTPQGPSWDNSYISKAWRRITKTHSFFVQPLQVVENNLLRLPGVLEVERYPDIKLDYQTSEPVYHENEKIG
jgi:hypothetical protein